MSDEYHRRESDKTWKRVVMWLTAIGGPMAVIACAAFIWNSASVIVHASDWVKSIPVMQKKLDDHETRIVKVEAILPYIKEGVDRLLDAQGIDRPEEKGSHE
jgi:hypothetical protein